MGILVYKHSGEVERKKKKKSAPVLYLLHLLVCFLRGWGGDPKSLELK